MKRQPLLILLFLVALIGSLRVQAETRWFAIYLGSTHVGHLQRSREEHAGVVESRNALALVLQRNGEPLAVSSSEWHRETVTGVPLGFSSEFVSGSTRARVTATIGEGEVSARIEQAGQHSERRFAWPEGAVLAEGQRLALLPLLAGRRDFSEVLAFDPAALQAQPLYSEKLAMELFDLEEGRQALMRIRQILGPVEGGLRSEIWIHPRNGAVEQMRLPALGLELTLRACSQACATAPPQAADVLVDTLLEAPRPISRRERGRPLLFALDAGEAALSPLARIPGQRLIADAPSQPAQLQVDPSGSAELPPTEADLQPARWLQSDDPRIREMAEKAVGRSRSADRRMQRLEEAVRRHISHKSLRVGYASAAEVIELREGDCTEHAVLLAALARAQGIPARVVTGLAYTPVYGGRQDVFVPHAWVMAWVGERWQGYDAALPAFGAAHIGLAMGDGDPFDFYSGLELLGRLQLRAVSPGVAP